MKQQLQNWQNIQHMLNTAQNQSTIVKTTPTEPEEEENIPQEEPEIKEEEEKIEDELITKKNKYHKKHER